MESFIYRKNSPYDKNYKESPSGPKASNKGFTALTNAVHGRSAVSKLNKHSVGDRIDYESVLWVVMRDPAEKSVTGP